MLRKVLIVTFTISVFFIGFSAYAQNNYQLLEPELWGKADGETITFQYFIENAYTIFLSLCIVTAIVMIIYNGLTYMVSETPFGKDKSKRRMWSAIQGLILALAAYLILYTINPNLVNVSLNLDNIVINNASTPTNPGGGGGPDTEIPNNTEPSNNPTPGEILTSSVPRSPNCHENPIPPECTSLRSEGVTVANWQGTNGPGRTDRTRKEVAQATKWVQQKLQEEKNLRIQVTAAHTSGVGHSGGSEHYQGIAVDLQPINGSERTTANLRLIADYCKRAGFTYTLVEKSHTHCDARPR